MYALHVNYPEALSHCGHGHDLTSVAQLSPPFHMGTAIRILSGFWHSHWQANPGLIRIETRIADPGGKQDFETG